VLFGFIPNGSTPLRPEGWKRRAKNEELNVFELGTHNPRWFKSTPRNHLPTLGEPKFRLPFKCAGNVGSTERLSVLVW
jgi:hypothetical protein